MALQVSCLKQAGVCLHMSHVCRGVMPWRTNKNLSIHPSWNFLCSFCMSPTFFFFFFLTLNSCKLPARPLYGIFLLIFICCFHYVLFLSSLLLLEIDPFFFPRHVMLASWAIMTFKCALRSSEPVLRTMLLPYCIDRFDSYPLLETTWGEIEVKGEIQCGCVRVCSVVFIVCLCSTFKKMYWLCYIVINYHVSHK